MFNFRLIFREMIALKMNKNVYIAVYTFPEERGQFHLEIFDNADAAIMCARKARESGSDWTFVDKCEVKKQLSEGSGVPEKED